MLTIHAAADALHMSPTELMNASLREYLEHQLLKIETEIFVIGHKYGVQTVEDLENRLLNRQTTEELAFEEFFELDGLIAQKNKMAKLLGEV